MLPAASAKPVSQGLVLPALSSSRTAVSSRASVFSDGRAADLPQPVQHRRLTNLGIGEPEEFSDQVIAALAPADYVLIDMVRFFRARDRSEQDVLQAKIERRFNSRGREIADTGDYRLMIFKLHGG